MSIISKSLIGGFVFIGMSTSALAQEMPEDVSDCERPEAPTISSDASEDYDMMVEAQTAVQNFMDSSNQYAACMDIVIAQVRQEGERRDGGNDNEDRIEELVEMRNATIDDQEAVADAFNRELQEYQESQE